MYVLYAFRHHANEWNQTLQAIPFRAGDGGDEVGAIEGVAEGDGIHTGIGSRVG
jgi:hypothetical protein